MGFECDWSISSDNKEDMMKEIAAHGMEAHGLTEADMTPEMMEKVESVITE
jgi:predicted small metal-binding protein